jgi:hypothetical protein
MFDHGGSSLRWCWSEVLPDRHLGGAPPRPAPAPPPRRRHNTLPPSHLQWRLLGAEHQLVAPVLLEFTSHRSVSDPNWTDEPGGQLERVCRHSARQPARKGWTPPATSSKQRLVCKVASHASWQVVLREDNGQLTTMGTWRLGQVVE